jgi:hypothetical protein
LAVHNKVHGKGDLVLADCASTFDHEPARPPSKFVDHIHAEKELVSGSSVVVSLGVLGVIEAKFRPEHSGAAYISGEVKRIFRGSR